ncbi:MAG TPA: hypothetical protein PKM25_00830 [Candidatus Ozemobacteraceae bacterium]|nr:hypothetical protein [Candidatus Ozemobacteraceae bacterium]
MASSAEKPLQSRGMQHRARISLALIVSAFVFIVFTAEAKLCGFCNVAVPDASTVCPSCLRATGWTSAPPRSRPAAVVVRRGRDAFIRGPNDAHPDQRAEHNAGGQRRGPIGSWYTVTGLRYLVRFEIPEACAEARIDPATWKPDQATLVLRLVPDRDAREAVPLVAYALARPFEEGSGSWGIHERNERGCSWTMATGELPWSNAGGDYFLQPRAWGTLPRKGAAEVEIDVTDIMQTIFDSYQHTGRWEDFGLIIMRDPEVPARCTYREIYSFEAASDNRGHGAVVSPELYLQ